MNLGDVFDGEVRDLTSQGQGVVAHPNGATVFVSGVWLEERVRLKVTGKKGRVGFAQLEAILTPSKYRKQPECPHQGASLNQCGGCPWMHVEYPAQVLAKQKRVVESFARLADNLALKPIIPAPEMWRWRNRAQFKTDGENLGYVAGKTNRLVPISQCPILSEKNQATLNGLLTKLPNRDWVPSRKDRWVTIDINHDSISINKRLPFQQANEAQNKVIQRWLLNKLNAIEKKDKVLELFCGSGNLTQIIADSGVSEIIAVEGVEEAISNLKAQNIAGVTAIQSDLFSEASVKRIFNKYIDADVLIVDPPRDGLKEKSGFFGGKKYIKHILYISCDLATLVRDVSGFLTNGYIIRELQPVDQFPHTPHIELLCHMEYAG